MKNIIYEKKFLNTVRIIAILIVTLLIIVTSLRIYRIFNPSEEISLSGNNIIVITENILAIFFSFLLIIYPQKLEYLAIICFIYSFDFLVFDLDNPMGILMFALGIVVSYVRGIFINGKKYKVFITISIFLSLLISGIHFGYNVFFYSLINKVGYSLVISIIIFLLIAYKNTSVTNMKTSSKILNLAEYNSLVENDVILLRKVLENEQYKNIAAAVYRTEGTVRNRLNKIYDILGVMDRMGFISTYMGYEIVFQKDEITKKQENSKNFLYKKKKKKKKKKK